VRRRERGVSPGGFKVRWVVRACRIRRLGRHVRWALLGDDGGACGCGCVTMIHQSYGHDIRHLAALTGFDIIFSQLFES